MPIARTPNVELSYERRGNGAPLLLIMGMSGTHLHWGEPFLSELEPSFDVVAYDHRGVGKSSRVEAPFTIAQLADDAAALMAQLGWDSAHVVGISMGGMVAQELAVRHPERLRSLTLGCTYAGGAEQRLTEPAVITELMQSWSSGDREQAIRAGFAVNVSARYAAEPEHYAGFRRIALALPVAIPVIMEQMRAISGHDTSQRLGEVRVPTLVIHGTEDRMLPAENARWIASAIPGARLELMDGVGHLFFWERPAQSAALIGEIAAAAQPA
ncbi:MAG: alpha/beta fold hydrolase [Actinobacteria bacterium]|nr:MAG: alpha/beta fold hydrolase [Actinomycetota bacterium]